MRMPAGQTLLKAEVVLATRSVITANGCQNQNILFAISDGGGGTYGVVFFATAKTHVPRFLSLVRHSASFPRQTLNIYACI